MQRQTIKQKMLENLRTQSRNQSRDQDRSGGQRPADPQGERPRTVTLYM